MTKSEIRSNWTTNQHCSEFNIAVMGSMNKHFSRSLLNYDKVIAQVREDCCLSCRYRLYSLASGRCGNMDYTEESYK